MKCRHKNPAGYVFCGVCGRPLEALRCVCGYVAGAGDVFCGRCGASLSAIAAVDEPAVAELDNRLDLEQLTRVAAQEKQFLESTHKARVTQDDIRKLLARRRKKF